MVLPRKRTLCFLSLTPRRLSVLLLVLLVYIVVHRLPENSHAGRWLPEYNVEDIPRFLHRSPYRKTPDYEYERSVLEALEQIEQAVLAQNGGDIVAEDRIWQIRVGKHPETETETETETEGRGSDSLMFEQRNKDWQYTFVTDAKANDYITTLFATIPHLQTLYNSYPYDVLRSDLLRYLLLWYFGGYYADMDLFPAKPIRSCPTLVPILSSLRSGNANISLMVGIEIDEPHASQKLMRDWRWIRRYGFIQYTMYAPQRFSPLLRQVIVRVLAHTKQHSGGGGSSSSRSGSSRYRIPLLSPRYTEKTILEVTGPGVFTDSILDLLSQTLPPSHPLIVSSVRSDEGIGDLISDASEGPVVTRRVTWAPFHRIREPVCVDAREAAAGKALGGLCVLPVSVWGNGQRHSGAEGYGGANACVNHRFGGSWKRGLW